MTQRLDMVGGVGLTPLPFPFGTKRASSELDLDHLLGRTFNVVFTDEANNAGERFFGKVRLVKAYASWSTQVVDGVPVVWSDDEAYTVTIPSADDERTVGVGDNNLDATTIVAGDYFYVVTFGRCYVKKAPSGANIVAGEFVSTSASAAGAEGGGTTYGENATFALALENQSTDSAFALVDIVQELIG